MKIRYKYILFIGLIHIVALCMSYFIFEEYKLLFIASEIVILVSLYFSYRLYKSLVQPIQLINRGVNAIKDRDFNVKFQELGQTEMDGLIAIYNQMIDQLREERIEKTQKHYFLEKLIRNSPTGIIILNLDQEISTCNPVVQNYLQIEEKNLLNQKIEGVKHPLLSKIAKLKVGETKVISINGLETFKCHKAQFIDQGFPNFFIMIEELTAEKLQIEKQAYGKAIRMMAHEVNNSIGPINSILESLEIYAQYLPKEEQETYIEVLKIAHQRNDKLNLFMENFAKIVRLPEPIKERIDIRELIERMANFMSYQLTGKEVEFDLDLPDKAVWVNLDTKQMEQVLINLIKNAIEAIEKKGKITLQLTRKNPTLKIKDTGIGFSEDFQIFSPFFSTKKNGQGIGLTLSREILHKHGFHFSFTSPEEGGAEFKIMF